MFGNSTLMEYLTNFPQVEGHRPWPRFRLDLGAWRHLVAQLAVCDWQVLGLWGDSLDIHVALRGEQTGAVAVASLTCADRSFPSLSQVRPGVIRMERAVSDLWGLVPAGLIDRRPWLDHGRWPLRGPLAGAPAPASDQPYPYAFLTAEGKGLHQIPVGPVHAGVIEPGHFRFHCQGETVVRLEERLGYTHKGVQSLMAGRSPAEAVRLAGRISGDSTVAYAVAFSRAVEAATGAEVPPRAHWLRGLLAEIERIANHVFDFGAVCNDAAFAIMLAECGMLRETVLRANQALFGHRLLMDRVVPGGMAVDLPSSGPAALRALVAEFRPRFEELVRLYDETPSLLDRTTGTGVVAAALAHRFGAGGFVGRASSQAVDSRRAPGYPPYDELDPPVSVHPEGDVHARLMVRVDEIRTSLDLIERILAHLPDGPVRAELPAGGGEGLALVESFRGELLLWVRLAADGTVARCHARDPSWLHWPLLEAAIEGNIVADFPLCNKSFNCSYSGHDL